MAKTGRKQKPYETSWGEIVPGLNRQGNDGRWRIMATGFRWTEADEHKAVQKAKSLLGLDRATTTEIQITLADLLPDAPSGVEGLTPSQIDQLAAIFDAAPELDDSGEFDEGEMQNATFKLPVADAILFPWLRRMFHERPEWIATKIGIPALARYADWPDREQPSIKLTAIREFYLVANPSNSKAHTVRQFNHFLKETKAKTLADLTNDVLHNWRNTVEADPAIKSANTKKWVYGVVKSVIGFAKKSPTMNATEIRAALDRCKLLWTAQEPEQVQPHPISRADFHALLDAATPQWRAWLLLGLNAAMYLEELSTLEWSHVDLEEGTLAMVRTKTRRRRIPRAATLWPETVAALKALPRGPRYVFTSNTGTRYKSSGARANKFAKLRTRAKVSDDVSFSHLRDGAFTAACRATDTRVAKILAGHSAGMEDHYVLRDPKIVRPACDAVYKVYGPF